MARASTGTVRLERRQRPRSSSDRCQGRRRLRGCKPTPTAAATRVQVVCATTRRPHPRRPVTTRPSTHTATAKAASVRTGSGNDVEERESCVSMNEVVCFAGIGLGKYNFLLAINLSLPWIRIIEMWLFFISCLWSRQTWFISVLPIFLLGYVLFIFLHIFRLLVTTFLLLIPELNLSGTNFVLALRRPFL